jgi:hypothetical protein
MPAWLSEDWVAASGAVLTSDVDVFGDATGVVAVEVGGADGGVYWREWAAGVPVRGGVGKPEELADLTLGLTAAEAQAFWRGEWSPSVAFMRGQLKTAGDNALLFALLASVSRPKAAALLAEVEALTASS